MNIVISSAGKDWRGTDNVTWTLVTGLRRRNHNVLVLCRPDSVLTDRLAEANIPFAAILSGLDLSPVVLMRCIRVLKQFKAQIVVTVKDKDLRQSAVAARMIGIPVLVAHGTDRPLKNTARYRFFFSKIATHHVAVSKAVRKTLLESSDWLTRDVAVVYNGIETAEVDAATPAQLDVPADAVTVSFVGHFEMRKGILDFAEAWHRVSAAVPNAHALIVGQGRREPEFRAALEGAARVHWLGFRSDVPSINQATDIFVLPSRFEGFGLVLAEAMAAGAACVTYDTSNMPELIDHERNGLLVPVGDTAALADAVIRLCRDETLRKRLGAAAAQTVHERFSAERMTEDYEALIAGIVRGGHTRTSNNASSAGM